MMFGCKCIACRYFYDPRSMRHVLSMPLQRLWWSVAYYFVVMFDLERDPSKLQEGEETPWHWWTHVRRKESK